MCLTHTNQDDRFPIQLVHASSSSVLHTTSSPDLRRRVPSLFPVVQGAVMMRTMRTVLPLLLTSQLAWSAPPKVPEKIEVGVNDDYELTLEIPADTEIGMAKGFPAKDCTFFGPVLNGNKRTYLVRPKKAGSYYVTFWTKGEVDHVQTIITTTGGGGDGGGGDGGNSPTDPFTKSLLDAYSKEPTETRLQDAKALVAVYRKLGMGTDGIYNPNIVNEDQLLTLIVTARAAMVAERMPLVREAIASQYASAFTGNPTAPVSTIQKNKVADTLLKSANILEGVK